MTTDFLLKVSAGTALVLSTIAVFASFGAIYAVKEIMRGTRGASIVAAVETNAEATAMAMAIPSAAPTFRLPRI